MLSCQCVTSAPTATQSLPYGATARAGRQLPGIGLVSSRTAVVHLRKLLVGPVPIRCVCGAASSQATPGPSAAAAQLSQPATNKQQHIAGTVADPGPQQPHAAATGSAAAGAAAVVLPPCQPGDVFRAVCVDQSELFFEVLPCSSSTSSTQQQQPVETHSVTVTHQGVVYTLTAVSSSLPGSDEADSSSSSSSSSSNGPSQSLEAAARSTNSHFVLQPQGWLLQPDADLVKALPGWPAAVQQQQSCQQLPQQPVLLHSVSVVSSDALLQAVVQQNPGPWRDGTGPSDPPVRGLQYALLSAGELTALLAGQRGVVMLQLWVGWDASAGQPIHNPLVLTGLRRALARKDISVFMSPAPGGLGLSAILTAAVEPYRSWGRHLAGFGAQAALVADSPYYKLLIGRILGYAEPNIRHHILATTGRPVAPEVVAAVDADLRGLSKIKPRLPWTTAAAAAAPSQGDGGGSRQQQQQQQQQQPAGQQRQQQLPRSARKKQRK